MPYDPNLPQAGTEIDADQMRSQLNGLNDLIQAVPVLDSAAVDATTTLPPGTPAQASVSVVGNTLRFEFQIPEGVTGAQGPAFANAVVDGVTTLNPGEAATVSVSFDGTLVHFAFGIPRGDVGQQGVPGQQGGPGVPGPEGPQGPPFANAVVDGVTTLNPGDPATVGVTFDGTNVHFTFGIPQGVPGPNGEVTEAEMASAIAVAVSGAVAGTSSNSNVVATLGMVVSDPPTQSEMQTLANKVDELILALRR